MDEIQLKLEYDSLKVQNAKLENRITHLMHHINSIEQTDHNNDYETTVKVAINDLKNLLDVFESANSNIMDRVTDPNIFYSTPELIIQMDFEQHLNWMMFNLKSLLEKFPE